MLATRARSQQALGPAGVPPRRLSLCPGGLRGDPVCSRADTPDPMSVPEAVLRGRSATHRLQAKHPSFLRTPLCPRGGQGTPRTGGVMGMLGYCGTPGHAGGEMGKTWLCSA